MFLSTLLRSSSLLGCNLGLGVVRCALISPGSEFIIWRNNIGLPGLMLLSALLRRGSLLGSDLGLGVVASL